MSAIRHSLNPKTYKYLRNVRKIPLPSLSTLNSWAANFNILLGILKKSSNVKTVNLYVVERLFPLFDIMLISNKINIDTKKLKSIKKYTDQIKLVYVS